MSELNTVCRDERQNVPPSVDYEQEFCQTIRYGNKAQVGILLELKKFLL